MPPPGSRAFVQVLLLLTVMQACSVIHARLENPPIGKPTPIELNYPSWARDSMFRPGIPFDNPTTVEGVALGRRLFYEKAMSLDGSLSCASCHRQEAAFSDPRRYSPGPGGNHGGRNAMALMNLAWSHSFFWDARAHTLEGQAFQPVRDHREMQNAWPEVIQRLKELPGYEEQVLAAFGTMEIDSMHIVKALAQFERTLISFDSRFDRFHYGCDSSALSGMEQHGLNLFFGKAHCVDCHAPPLFQDHNVANIGLDSVPADRGMGGRTGIPWHMGRFKTPSLRNIGASAPYMHDGRFATLEQVVDFYADDVHTEAPNFDDHMFAWKQGVVRLDSIERRALIAFLSTLTDSTFLNDPRHGPPSSR